MGLETPWAWSVEGAAHVGRTWSSYNPDQKVKTRALKEKDVAGSPGILVNTGDFDPGAGIVLLDTMPVLRSPQASCLFVSKSISVH